MYTLTTTDDDDDLFASSQEFHNHLLFSFTHVVVDSPSHDPALWMLLALFTPVARHSIQLVTYGHPIMTGSAIVSSRLASSCVIYILSTSSLHVPSSYFLQVLQEEATIGDNSSQWPITIRRVVQGSK